jgi:hypothetical protein
VFASATSRIPAGIEALPSYEWQITFLAQASPQEIVSYYKTSLMGLGFTVTVRLRRAGRRRYRSRLRSRRRHGAARLASRRSLKTLRTLKRPSGIDPGRGRPAAVS